MPYGACFRGALGVVARRRKADVSGSRVTTKVGFGKNEAGGLGLEVVLEVSIPKVDRATAGQLVEEAPSGCPYSNATRGNIRMDLSVV